MNFSFTIVLQMVLIDAIFSQNIQVCSGTVQRIPIFASHYVEPRHIDVWLPADYSPDKKYAVLYMHDGQMLYDAADTWNKQEWGVDESITALLQLHKIRNCIVVGIWNTPKRNLEYCMEDAHLQFDTDAWKLFQTDAEAIRLYQKGNFLGNNYLQFIVEELKPYIDNHYSTLPDRANTFIAGSSRGGLIS
ncbi:MAG: alpha/beta hydrolase, partial [Chitinophagales bacterium]